MSWAPLVEEAGEGRALAAPGAAALGAAGLLRGAGRERAALEEAMKLARAGQRQVVLLSGEPGIGKTRLASYAAHGAHAEGFAVCWGACAEELGGAVRAVDRGLLAARRARTGGAARRACRAPRR